jgi:hypothetical protein
MYLLYLCFICVRSVAKSRKGTLATDETQIKARRNGVVGVMFVDSAKAAILWLARMVVPGGAG